MRRYLETPQEITILCSNSLNRKPDRLVLSEGGKFVSLGNGSTVNPVFQ